MKQKFSGDGRAAGSIMVLQALVAQLLANHPQHERILASVANMTDGLEDDIAAAASSSDTETFMFLGDLAAGARETLTVIHTAVAAHPDG